MKSGLLPSYLARSASLLFEGLRTPKSLTAAVMLREGDWDGLAKLSADPRSYTCSESYFRDAAAVAFLKKLQELPNGTAQRSSLAKEKWWDGERACYRSNERLTVYTRSNRNSSDRVAGVEALFALTQKIILSWIGPQPPDLLSGRFGPGATFSDRGGKTTVPDKMSSEPSLTHDALWFLPQWYGTQWGAALAQRRGKVSFIRGNRFATVPKTSLIDRAIAAEPSINVFYQLALGGVIRSRLRSRAGWDLDRAQDIHRQVACRSSVTREFATLDLSNASDTVCKTLVEVLLPPRWHDQLNDLRSKATLIDGKWVHLEKFSSMGNGYTFELETLIFAALCCATLRLNGARGHLGADVFVFGDDIIIPGGMVRCVKSVLEYCGFSLNAEKSYFGDEPFRESCGGDYFNGKPVRPFYLKALPTGPQDFVALSNGLTSLRDSLLESGFVLDLRAWLSVLDCLPTTVKRCRGPKALGDTVIWDSPETWSTRWRHSIRYVRGIVATRHRVVSFDNFDAQVVLACATYGTGNRQGGVIPRDGVLGYGLAWLAFS